MFLFDEDGKDNFANHSFIAQPGLIGNLDDPLSLITTVEDNNVFARLKKHLKQTLILSDWKEYEFDGLQDTGCWLSRCSINDDFFPTKQ